MFESEFLLMSGYLSALYERLYYACFIIVNSNYDKKPSWVRIGFDWFEDFWIWSKDFVDFCWVKGK